MRCTPATSIRRKRLAAGKMSSSAGRIGQGGSVRRDAKPVGRLDLVWTMCTSAGSITSRGWCVSSAAQCRE